VSEPLEFTAQKHSFAITVSKELLRDCEPMRKIDWELLMGLREPTPKERAASKRFAAKQARLKAASLLDDHGWPKRADECPAGTYLGNYDSDELVRCERKVGHRGPHKFVVEWDAA
jgi:hypothetical protein